MGNASGNVKAGMVEFMMAIARLLPSIINHQWEISE
jgi:hypothetical protein